MKRITYNHIGFSLCCMAILSACTGKKKADAILHHGIVYQVDDDFNVAEAVAIKDGKILAVGTNAEVLSKYESEHTTDLQGKALYPGFIDAHCHFYGYGMNQQQVNLVGTTSFDEILDKLKQYDQQSPEGWLMGRGWDQNDWKTKEFPTCSELDKLFPNRPVFIQRVDGHAALVNSKALSLAGITNKTSISGGRIEKNGGKLTGILVDNAVEMVEKVIPKPTQQQITKALLQAQTNCFAVGLTTVDDAGLDKRIVLAIDSLQQQHILKMRVYAMLLPTAENKQYFYNKGPYTTEKLSVTSFKVYADGALGSRGACLLSPYSDRTHQQGFLLHTSAYFDTIATELASHGFQMNTHCIGDSANRRVLTAYAKALKGPNEKRWRIEHAQVVEPTDMPMYKKYIIIPSVQPTHATSDMYWAEERLGAGRVRCAYAYKELMQQNGVIANGSDFPVESINPLFGFYAAVVRKDQKGYPAKGFQIENALTREQALRAMTIWAAYANFEDKVKGSIAVGKYADLVVLKKDIMKAPDDSLFSIQVDRTILAGEVVYEAK